MDGRIQITLIFLGIFVIVIILGIIENNREKKSLLNSIKSDYGKKKNSGSGKSIIHDLFDFDQKNGKSFYVDEITCSDIDADSVFDFLNHTKSSAGEDALYEYFRIPATKSDEIRIHEADVNYFENNSSQRENVLYQLVLLGKNKIGTTISYLFKEHEKPNILKQIAGTLIILGGVGVVFINALWGTVIFIIGTVISIMIYFSSKAEIYSFLDPSFYIIRLIQCARNFEKLKINDDENCPDNLKRVCKEISDDKKLLAGLMRGAGYVSLSSSVNKNILSVIIDYINMLFHIDILLFISIDKALIKNKDSVIRLYRNIGYIDSIISVGSLRKSLKLYCVPEFNDNEDCYIKEISHPLIKNPVSNDVEYSEGMLLTGSNASGKSTFLKTYAIAIIMAQSVNTVIAREYRMPFLRVYTSMSVKDNIFKGDSFFVAELKSIKRIITAVDSDSAPVICFVDEVLKGTNTNERIAASSQIAVCLENKGIKTVFATHDGELTILLADILVNYHFEETINENDTRFSYKLLKGPATTTNAIKLMEVLGFDKNVTENARAMAQNFAETKEWKML